MSAFGFVFNLSQGMVPLVYLVGAVAMLFTAASYVTMSRRYPISGSVYAYAGRAIGQGAGFLGGWVMLLDYLLGPALTYIGAAVAIHAAVPQVPKIPCIIGLVLLNTVFATRGIQVTARLSFVFLGLQIATIVVFLAGAMFAFMQGTNGAELTIKPFFNPDLATPSLIFGALSLAVLSFLGFDAISTLSEEAREGPTSVARATYLALLLIAGIFVLQTYVACLFVLEHTRFPDGDGTAAAFYNIAFDIGGWWLMWMVTVPAVLFAGIPGALAAQVATSRLIYSMARDSRLPTALAHVSDRHGVPDHAALLVCLVTLVLGIAFSEQMEFVATLVCFGALSGFLLLHASVIVLAIKGELQSWSPLLAAIGAVIIGYVLLNMSTNAMKVGLGWLAIGAVLLVCRPLLPMRAKQVDTSLPR